MGNRWNGWGRCWLPVALASLLGACATLPQSIPSVPANDQQATVAESTARIQQHRDWRFPADGVTFSNRLESARLNDVERLGDGRYAVTIAPEIVPINPSPWYGFTVASDREQPITIAFRYKHAKPRYQPKLSRDGEHWIQAGVEQMSEGPEGSKLLTVTVGPQPLRVFAQPPIGIDAFAQWERDLLDRGVARRSVIGHSEQGRPLHMLMLGNPEARQVVLVMGRQHPPETTGSQALMGFVDALADDSSRARRFRDQMLIIVVPLLNPDGVVEGNWRGNINGQDLNRDWGPFTQAETQAVRDMLRREIDQADRKLVFAIDFHSTWSDVLYTVQEDPSRMAGGVLRQWIDGMQQRYPDRIRESASPSRKSTVFKNWAFSHYHVPAVTYEVGDKTGAEALEDLADFAAGSLMDILLDHAAAGSVSDRGP